MGLLLNKWRLVFYWGIISGLLLVQTPAGAYVLPGTYLLDLMTLKARHVKRLLVSQKLLIYDGHSRQTPAELDETLHYALPESFRSDIETTEAKRIHISHGGLALTVIDGRISPQAESVFDRYKDILFYRSREALNERLTLLGVDVTLTSLGRFQGKVAYVMGAQYPDESYSQIWIDRDTFRPLRWLLLTGPAGSDAKNLEVRYLEWQQLQGIWYPMRIEFYEGERILREIKVADIRVNPSFPKDLFNVEYVKSIYKPADDVTPDERKPEVLPELQKTIEDFKRMYQ